MAAKSFPQEVLTLEEAASFLRVKASAIEELIGRQGLPARMIDGEWRFLAEALRDWLKHPGKHALLLQAGALKNDPTLPEIMKAIEEERSKSRRKRA